MSIVVVALVRRGFRYLMVRDDTRGGVWYPPAGALEPGEDLITAGKRIVRAASGYTPEFTGLVGISHMPMLPGGVGRWRYVVEGRVGVDALFDETAVVHSTYLLPAEIRGLPLRNDDIAELIEDHARGKQAAPIELYSIGLG